MARFRTYGDAIALQSADKLITHKTEGGRVVVIEYEVHGTIRATGVKSDNRFCSIIRIENRKIAHWRDTMDSLAAWNALTAHTAKTLAARSRRRCAWRAKWGLRSSRLSGGWRPCPAAFVNLPDPLCPGADASLTLFTRRPSKRRLLGLHSDHHQLVTVHHGLQEAAIWINNSLSSC